MVFVTPQLLDFPKGSFIFSSRGAACELPPPKRRLPFASFLLCQPLSSLWEQNTCLQATLATFPTPFFGLQLSSSDAVFFFLFFFFFSSVYWMREEMALR